MREPAPALWENRPRLDREQEERFFAGAREATRFFAGKGDVHLALESIARLLEEKVPGALAGRSDHGPGMR